MAEETRAEMATRTGFVASESARPPVVQPNALALDFAITKPAPRRLVTHTHLFGILRKFHAYTSYKGRQ